VLVRHDLDLDHADTAQLIPGPKLTEPASIGCRMRGADLEHGTVREGRADHDVAARDGPASGAEDGHGDDSPAVDAVDELPFAQ
jgi:hypothetical protein